MLSNHSIMDLLFGSRCVFLIKKGEENKPKKNVDKLE